MLRHIALHINQEEEIQKFYSEVLQFNEFHRFTLDSKVASAVFGIQEPVLVVRMRQFNVELELLIHSKPISNSLAHHAFEFWRMHEVFSKAEKMNYKTTRVAKENGRMAFYVDDAAGNHFELKEINNF